VKRGGPLRRKTRLRAVGKKAKRDREELELTGAVVRLRSSNKCEAQVPGVCTGAGQHIHHRKLRSQGGDNLAKSLLHVCFKCHRYIHDHPAESYERGWLIRAFDASADAT